MHWGYLETLLIFVVCLLLIFYKYFFAMTLGPNLLKFLVGGMLAENKVFEWICSSEMILSFSHNKHVNVVNPGHVVYDNNYPVFCWRTTGKDLVFLFHSKQKHLVQGLSSVFVLTRIFYNRNTLIMWYEVEGYCTRIHYIHLYIHLYMYMCGNW